MLGTRLAAPALALSLALSTLVGGGCTQTTPRGQAQAPSHDLMLQAERKMLSGDEAGALADYRAFRQGFADAAMASECHYWEGVLLLKQGRLDEAEKSLRSAMGAPRSAFLEVQASIALGDVRFVRDDYEGAIECYQRALDRRVPDARNDYALYRLGVARQRSGDWDAGRSCYQLLCRDHGKSALKVRAEQRLRYPDRTLHLQVGAFQDQAGAARLAESLHGRGIIARTVNLENGPAPWLVWVGEYPSVAHAQAALPEVQKLCGGDVVLVP